MFIFFEIWDYSQTMGNKLLDHQAPLETTSQVSNLSTKLLKLPLQVQFAPKKHGLFGAPRETMISDGKKWGDRWLWHLLDCGFNAGFSAGFGAMAMQLSSDPMVLVILGCESPLFFFTPPKLNIPPEKLMVGRWVSFWDWLFLVFRGYVKLLGCTKTS